ncbi:GroES-like protein [Rhizoctonia solani]|uniref:GroES-like protein n=1 Tax=Rhizoctonia solani TaxID=456999 RepID=A0A8H7H4L0_9AGAM|nr:GroES-like protein [Rhizoctonia solani]
MSTPTSPSQSSSSAWLNCVLDRRFGKQIGFAFCLVYGAEACCFMLSLNTKRYRGDVVYAFKIEPILELGMNISHTRMTQVPVPDITQPDDVIVKVTGTTICGSDLHLYHGEIVALQKGDILGHELIGVVDRVGENVKNLKPGQQVVASFQIACGQCSYCKQKLSSMCDKTNNSSLQNAMYGTRDAGFFGCSHSTGGFPGGQAEYVPYGNVNLMPIPDNVIDKQAIYLSDVIPTSYHCVVDTGVKEGDIVAVWRLAFASEKLGIETLNFKEHSDVLRRLRELVPGEVDVALDCGK